MIAWVFAGLILLTMAGLILGFFLWFFCVMRIGFQSWQIRKQLRPLLNRPRPSAFTDVMRWNQAEIEAHAPDWDFLRPKLLSTYLIDPETGRPGGDF